MAWIFVLSVDDDLREYDEHKHFAVRALRASAAGDRFGKHSLTGDPEVADLILFVAMGTCGDFAERVRVHPLYRNYPEKVFLFDWADHIRPVLPGLYASLHKKNYSPEHTRTGFYLAPENPMIDYRPLTGQEKYLAAFVGSVNTHPIREEIFKYDRPDIYLLDSSKESYRIRYHGTASERIDFWKRYADSIGDALFSVCPRGRGPGSIRLYESMKTGRGCIILSDDWVPNEGVDWESFAVFVPEKDAARVPSLMEELKPRAKEMGERARAEWEKWFAEDVRFHWVAELCLSMLEMRKQRKLQGRMRRLFHLRHIVSSRANLRRYMISKKNLYRLHGKIFW
jgi:Exostosin family